MDELLGFINSHASTTLHSKNVHTRSDTKVLREQDQLESIISRITTEIMAAFFADQLESIEAIETSVSGCFEAIEHIKLQVAALPLPTSALQYISTRLEDLHSTFSSFLPKFCEMHTNITAFPKNHTEKLEKCIKSSLESQKLAIHASSRELASGFTAGLEEQTATVTTAINRHASIMAYRLAPITDALDGYKPIFEKHKDDITNFVKNQTSDVKKR
ncbi:hypothetical protein F5882DRAFT_471408 [Hyaloscypha sp. PMI_1271]|nr:hypothetical protein F5882DRAFT_471408 [Hyaloscypha sp. PMI_1271]